MDIKKVIKTGKRITKAIPFVTAAIGVATLALAKYEEKQENFSREFPEIADDLKLVISEVREDNGN